MCVCVCVCGRSVRRVGGLLVWSDGPEVVSNGGVDKNVGRVTRRSADLGMNA